MRRRFIITALTWIAMGSAGAQDLRDLSVRTFTLRNLRSTDAAELIAPYITAPQGGVYEAAAVRAITVRETPSALAVIDSILRVHDRARAVLTLRFQIIAALDTVHTDPSIASIAVELRKLFRFAGYQLIGEGTTTTEELSEFAMTLSAQTRLEKGEVISEPFAIAGYVERVESAGADRTVRLQLSMQDGRRQAGQRDDLLKTGLSIPLGQSVVLGSSSPVHAFGSRVALILVVLPDLAQPPR